MHYNNTRSQKLRMDMVPCSRPCKCKYFAPNLPLGGVHSTVLMIIWGYLTASVVCIWPRQVLRGVSLDNLRLIIRISSHCPTCPTSNKARAPIDTECWISIIFFQENYASSVVSIGASPDSSPTSSTILFSLPWSFAPCSSIICYLSPVSMPPILTE